MELNKDIALQHRIVLLRGNVDRPWLDRMRQQTSELCLISLDPINVLIDSGGGNARCGMFAHDWLTALPCPVHTYAAGNCASSAFDVFLAGEKRYSLPHSVFVIHNVCLNIERLPADQDLYPRRLRERMREVKRDNKAFIAVYAKISTLSKKQLRKIMNEADQVSRDIDARQMMKWGFVHELVTKIPW